MIEPSRNQFPTTAMQLAAAESRRLMEFELLAEFSPIETSLIPHGIPGSGTCKWQCEWKMADGSTVRYPTHIRE